MPSARELLEQADALMRRNRARAVDTEIPELTEIVAEVVPAPSAVVVALDDVPELIDAVEEIEIASIVELPDDIDEASGWLHHDQADWGDAGREANAIAARLVPANPPGAEIGPVRSHLSIVGKPDVAATPPPDVELPSPSVGLAPPAAESTPPPTEPTWPGAEPTSAPTAPAAPAHETAPPVAGNATPALAIMPPSIEIAPTVTAIVAEALAALPRQEALRPPVETEVAEPPPAPQVEPVTAVPTPVASQAPVADDWARWEALAEEIRMQVLQRIDIFTDTRLRKQLGAQLQPIVDRASVQMVETINAEVGKLLRAYIAEAIEREIEKWRGTTR